MSVASIAGFVMLLSGGLLTGGAWMVAVERLWIWDRMDLPDYTADFRRSIHRADPMQPILGYITIAAAIVFAIDSDGAARALAIVAIAIYVAAFLVSILFNQPINKVVVGASDAVSPDADATRRRWALCHRIRTSAMVIGLGALAAAAVQ